METLELHDRPQRGPLHRQGKRPGLVNASGRARERRRALHSDRGHLRAAFLQPPDLGVADEPFGMGPGEDDRVDVGVRIGPIDQGVQLFGDVVAEQPERSSIEPHDEHSSSILDVEVSSDFCCHDWFLGCGRVLPFDQNNEVIPDRATGSL